MDEMQINSRIVELADKLIGMKQWLVTCEAGEQDCQVIGLWWMKKMYIVDIRKIENIKLWLIEQERNRNIRNIRIYELIQSGKKFKNIFLKKNEEKLALIMEKEDFNKIEIEGTKEKILEAIRYYREVGFYIPNEILIELNINEN